MNVLLFNFQQPDESWLGTGGVGVYLKSLTDELIGRGIKVVCLDSGAAYDRAISSPKIVFGDGQGYKRATIVNSPVVAPSHLNFFNEEEYLNSKLLDGFPAKIVARFGELDVIHLQNIEGLTLGFLKALRASNPKAKIIVSAHNYNLVCPQVNLWQNEDAVCKDFRNGNACVTCIGYRDATYIKRTRAKWSLRHRFSFLPNWLKDKLLARAGLPSDWEDEPYCPGAPRPPIDSSLMARSFRDFRASNVQYCRTVDTILSTSKRALEILVAKGLDHRNVSVSYIGSKAVDRIAVEGRRKRFGDVLNIAFIGYARKDKGFYFLIEALKSVPAEIAGHIALTVAARGLSETDIEKLGALELQAFRVYDGYDSDTLSAILKSAHLGIVPPLWEDNLPQVAIEMVALGLPILTSNYGGASEIACNADFQFEAGSVSSFVKSLSAIAQKEVPLSSFWNTNPNIRTMSMHVDELLARFYQ